jgi:tetratricopeptide (TPR) repeat protein
MMNMSTMSTRRIILSAVVALAAAACGSGQKKSTLENDTISGPGGGKSTPTAFGGDVKAEAAEPKREISKDAKADYQAALDFYTQQDKAGWSDGTCRQAADKFASVVREHKDLVEAQYMVGRSYHNCNMRDDATSAYKAALQIKANHGQSLSNLGELAFRAGKVGEAKEYWANAIKANPKLVAARNNLASLDLEDMRKTSDAGTWKQLEADARNNLSSALAVENDNIEAYVLYGLVYMEGRQKNKNRLDLAKLLLEEGAKRNEKYAPLENARGLYFLYRNNLTEALQHFMKAVELDTNFAEARMNVGLITLGFRKYDTAKDQFTKVLELQPKNYDAMIGLGIAQRGLGDFDGAEASYKKARDLDSRRGEAFYNLGVLYKAFKANKQSDLKASQEQYRTARDYFKQFLDKGGKPEDVAEAKDNITDCDKVIKQIDDFIKNMANQPPPPPTPPPAPAGGAAGAGSAGGAAAPAGDDKGGDKGDKGGDKGGDKDAAKKP